jgi:Undecaprenyl-phosphate galactose phosphotransferase WbaP
LPDVRLKSSDASNQVSWVMSDFESAVRPPIELTAGAKSALGRMYWQVWGVNGAGWRWLAAAVRICWDAAAALMAITAALEIRAAFHALPETGTLSAYAPLLIPLIFFFLGVYEDIGCNPVERLRRRTCGIALYFVFEAVAAFAYGANMQWAAALAGVTGPCLIILGYYGDSIFISPFVHRGLWGAPVALVGRGRASQELADALIARPELGLRPVGFVDLTSAGRRFEDRIALTPLRSSDVTLTPIRGIGMLLFASAADLRASGLTRGWRRLPISRVALAPSVKDIDSLCLHAHTLRGDFGVDVSRGLYSPGNLLLKRLLDCLIALPAAAVTLPIVAVLAIAVAIVDPGPVFYVQSRIGLHGRMMRVYKLRTMRQDAETRLADHLARVPAARVEWERHFKLANDPRILPLIGKIMRRASLDELPQLLNVIRGEMSLVGPRPFPHYHMKAFDEDFQTLRTSVPPGLTGLWQVSSRSDGDLAAQRNQDTQYIQNWSIWLDLYILLQTVPAVFKGKGV